MPFGQQFPAYDQVTEEKLFSNTISLKSTKSWMKMDLLSDLVNSFHSGLGINK